MAFSEATPQAEQEPSSVMVDGVKVELNINETANETRQIESKTGADYIQAAMDYLEQKGELGNLRGELEGMNPSDAESNLRAIMFNRLEARRQMVGGYIKLSKKPSGSYGNQFYEKISQEWSLQMVQKWLISNRAIHERTHIPENVRQKLGRDAKQSGRVDSVYRWFLLEEQIDNFPNAASLRKRLYNEKLTDVVPKLEDELNLRVVAEAERLGDEIIDSAMA